VRTKPRLVLDTHVWLDWLVFEDPGIVPIRNAVGTGQVELYVDAVCEEELARVLARGFAKRTLDAAAQAACIAQCRRLARRIDAAAPAGERARLPACRDPDDQKFLEAALAAGAQFLITKDRRLLELARHRARLPFRIVTPAAFAELRE
jgi:uncharacterized protein